MKSFNQNDKPALVQKIFNNIAPVYDLLNDIISFGLHKKWKSIAIDQLCLKPGDKVLDLCCGSGDISVLILEKMLPDIEITAVDFSPNMLKIAEKRLINYSQVIFVEADALNLPFNDNCFDRVIISFGLRNLANLTDGLKEINRVLKPTGTFVSLDFRKPQNVVIKILFNIYFNYFVPMLGKRFNKYCEYTYLTDSIKEFPQPVTLLGLMSESGFCNAENTNLFWGFIAIQKAYN